MRQALANHPGLYTRALLGIVLLAIGDRLAALAVLHPRLGVDSQSYLNQGALILQQGPLSFLSFAAEQSPLYSLLFSFCDAIAGPNAGWAMGILQTLMGGLTALLLASFASRALGDPFAGLLVGLLAAVHITFVFWSVYVLTDTLLLLLLALVMWCVLRLARTRSPFIDGLVTSLLLLLLVLTRRTNALASGVLLVMAGWIARTHRLAILGLALPFVLALAVLASGAMRARTGSALMDRAGAYAWQSVYMGLQWTEQGRATDGVDVHLSTIPDDAERGAFYRDQTLNQLRSDPGFFFVQAARKFKIMWLPFLPEDSPLHKALSTLYLLPLYALGLLGWFTSRRSGAFVLITTVGVAVFTLVCLITFVDYDQRYRLPAELFLIPLSGVGLGQVLAWIGAFSIERTTQTAVLPSAHHEASAG